MVKCLWCGASFVPRTDGGREQQYCRPACRRALDAAGRRYIAEGLASGAVTLDDLKSGPAATRALLAAPSVGFGDQRRADSELRFLVEIPRSTIEALIYTFRWLPAAQGDDLLAIVRALDRLNMRPSITRLS
jgi:hypothetical protein